MMPHAQTEDTKILSIIDGIQDSSYYIAVSVVPVVTVTNDTTNLHIQVVNRNATNFC